MAEPKQKSPASEEALDRTYANKSLRDACIVLIAHNVFYSNAEALVYAGVADIDNIAGGLRDNLERASRPDTHVGRTGAVSELASLVAHGLLSKRDAQWLRYVANLVSREGKLTIHPLFEVARRILAMHLDTEAWR